MNLRDKVNEALKTKPPKQSWFLITYRDDATGAFSGAVIMQAENSLRAAIQAHKVKGVEGDLSGYEDIPPERVPTPEYCNRALTADDLKTIWPDFFRGEK